MMSDAGSATPDDRLALVALEGEALTRLSPLQEADRAQAVADLAAENSFRPKDLHGPFHLHLSIQEGRLVFDIRNTADAPLTALGLALGPFRGLIKDYQLLVDSHVKAVEEGARHAYKLSIWVAVACTTRARS